ncbi:MAG: lysophospholipid acyltransferase family protein [Luteimonas sp.]
MIGLEERIKERFPRWFRGRRARVAEPLLRTLGRWSRFDLLDGFLAANGHLRDFAFVDAVCKHLQLRYRTDAERGNHIPARGRLLIVANHPSGALDALALLHCVGQVRRDVRIVANDVLTMIEPLADLLLPVRVHGARANPDGVRAIERALEADACVIVFPAGEVSRLGLRGLRDGRWRQGFLRFARRCEAPVLPIRIEARNSALFYGTSVVFKPAATALLAREMYARRGRPLTLRIGAPMRIDADADLALALRRVRKALYSLDRRSAPPRAMEAPLARSVDRSVLAAAVAATELLGETADGKQIRLAQTDPGSPLLQEIGRLRELTFRKVGEGTGHSLDLDRYDPHYQHVLVWDVAARNIAGAYRIARGARMLASGGLDGFYTASLFRYADDAVPRLAQGLELGRSFVAPEYWSGRSLDYLWQGIGAYLRRYPDVRYLFGAVSISAALPIAAREQLVAYYQRYFGSQDALAQSRRPFAYFAAPPSFGELDADTAYRVLKQNLDALGATVPMLYKQYTELCEPGGARFLAFGVDPNFSDSIDGLIEVDLHRIRPNKRKRYLHAVEAVA